MLIGPDANGGMDAITGGTTELVGSCLGARQGSALYAVVWPHGTKVPADCLEVADADEVMWVQSVDSVTRAKR